MYLCVCVTTYWHSDIIDSHLGYIGYSLHHKIVTVNRHFGISDLSHLYVFRLWTDTGAPGGNPLRHRENMQTSFKLF